MISRFPLLGLAPVFLSFFYCSSFFIIFSSWFFLFCWVIWVVQEDDIKLSSSSSPSSLCYVLYSLYSHTLAHNVPLFSTSHSFARVLFTSLTFLSLTSSSHFFFFWSFPSPFRRPTTVSWPLWRCWGNWRSALWLGAWWIGLDSKLPSSSSSRYPLGQPCMYGRQPSLVLSGNTSTKNSPSETRLGHLLVLKICYKWNDLSLTIQTTQKSLNHKKCSTYDLSL